MSDRTTGEKYDVYIFLTPGERVSYSTSAKGRDRLETWLSGNVDDCEFYVARSVGADNGATFVRRRDISAVHIFRLRQSAGVGFTVPKGGDAVDGA